MEYCYGCGHTYNMLYHTKRKYPNGKEYDVLLCGVCKDTVTGKQLLDNIARQRYLEVLLSNKPIARKL